MLRLACREYQRLVDLAAVASLFAYSMRRERAVTLQHCHNAQLSTTNHTLVNHSVCLFRRLPPHPLPSHIQPHTNALAQRTPAWVLPRKALLPSYAVPAAQHNSKWTLWLQRAGVFWRNELLLGSALVKNSKGTLKMVGHVWG